MGWSSRRARALLLTTLLMLVLVPSTDAQTETSAVLDQAINGIDLVPEESVMVHVHVASNSSALLSWSCSSCTVEVDDTSSGITTAAHGSSMLSVEVEETTTLDVTLSSTATESVSLMVLKDIDDEHHHAVRPSPGTDTSTAHLGVCVEADDCVEASTGSLSSQLNLSSEAMFLHAGDVQASEVEYLVFNCSRGDTLEWQWLATTHALNLQMYHQTDDEEQVLAGNFSATASFSQNGQQPVAAAYWTAPDNGRFCGSTLNRRRLCRLGGAGAPSPAPVR